jgi:hypothetical protein
MGTAESRLSSYVGDLFASRRPVGAHTGDEIPDDFVKWQGTEA